MTSSDYLAASGELAFQFMHWPMSFLNLQSKILKGAKDAALSGQWDAPEFKQALRFAGIYAMVDVLSLTTNLDFTNLLENDTVAKIQDWSEYLTGDEEELKRNRGLVQDLTGPVVGDIFYGLNMFQLYKMPDEDWQKMVTGYIDYYGEGDVPDWVNPKKIIDEIKITPVEYADEVLKIALTKELKKTEWVEVELSKKDDKSQASIQ